MKKLLLLLSLITTPPSYAMENSIKHELFKEPEPQKEGDSCVFLNINHEIVATHLLFKKKKKQFFITIIKHVSGNVTDYSDARLCTEEEREKYEQNRTQFVEKLKQKITDFENEPEEHFMDLIS